MHALDHRHIAAILRRVKAANIHRWNMLGAERLHLLIAKALVDAMTEDEEQLDPESFQREAGVSAREIVEGHYDNTY